MKKSSNHWSSKYVGLPYEQADCAELCVKVQKEVFDRDIDLPVDRANGLRGVSRQIDYLKADFAEPIDCPEEGDAVLMVGRGRLNHIGTICFINGQMWILHAMKNTGRHTLHPQNP